jgi:hypothetical protein
VGVDSVGFFTCAEEAFSLSSLSFLFSSLDFFLGRVCWLMVDKSILPTTVTFDSIAFFLIVKISFSPTSGVDSSTFSLTISSVLFSFGSSNKIG